ncbi:MAG: amidohydrolase family protein, partial [Cyclobacteriaceae bacterium]
MRVILLMLAVIGMNAYSTLAQENFPLNGIKDKRPGVYAFTNATIFTDYQTKLEKATLVVENGKVKAVGKGVAIPKGAIITDLAGKTVYPAWVEPYGSYGLPGVPKRQRSFNSAPQYESKRKGPFGWNENVLADYRAVENINFDKKNATELKKYGFGAVNAIMENGIVRGTSALVTLAELPVQGIIISEDATANFSFQNAASSQQYPNSIMGRVALIRQTYMDADWYRSSANSGEVNISLKDFNRIRKLPAIFEVSNKQRALLADKIGDEMGVQYIIKGNGDEYQWAEAIKKTGASFILPLDFPKAYDVEDPYAVLDISYEQMKHWENAPANPGILAEKGVVFAFTADRMKKKSQYLENIRKSIEYGLSETEALKAMTVTPARLVGAADKVGSLKKGMHANFVITSGNIFEKDAVIYETWVQGTKSTVSDMNTPDLSGKYTLSIDGEELMMDINGVAGKQKITVKESDSVTYKGKSTIDGKNIKFSYSEKGEDGAVRLSGWRSDDGFKGDAQLPDGNWVKWSAKRNGDPEADAKKIDGNKEEAKPEIGKMLYPFMAYGYEAAPKQQKILFRNATVWTNESDGILENADVLVEGGKIHQIGKSLSAKGAMVVDATGKHLTSGIIDEHSHAALSGVNESSHAVTAEVRMYDAVDSEDVDIYRQLAGGVTAAQLLHGSANPIGGQSAIVKFRWGVTPEEMQIKGADGFIKFALGENVKQSNWGDNNTIRFPQTRMGVEQVFINAFTKAQEYDAKWNAYNNLSSKEKQSAKMPRRDLQLEALSEIVNSRRFISCHSYV